MIAPVLKTGRLKGLVSSNLTPSANIIVDHRRVWQSVSNVLRRSSVDIQPTENPVAATLRLRKRAFACGLLRRERSRFALGVRDGAFAAGKPGNAGDEDQG